MGSHDVAETTETPSAAPVERVAVASGELALAERVLGLQRTIGNAAVVRMLARQTTGVAEQKPVLPPGVKQGADKVEITELKFVLIFSGGNQLYQTQARRFVKVAMSDYTMIDVGSMQEAMSKMLAEAKSKETGGTPVRIDEIQIIAHANETGFIRMPLVPGRKGTTVDEFARLQDEFAHGGFTSFQDTRAQLLPLIDANTNVIVRGCQVGAKVPALADAFAAFFGGQATVHLAKRYMAFTRMRIGGPMIKNAIEAYDFLESHNFIPYGTAYDDAGKKAWVRQNLPDGYVPEMFFVAKEDVEKVRHAGADDPGIQGMKEYEPAQHWGDDDYWQAGRSSLQDADDPDLDRLSAKEIVEKAAGYLAQLRAAEARSDEDWKALGKQMGTGWPPDVLAWYTIGEKAWWVLRCHRAWMRKPEASQVNTDDLDPIAGLTMPGLAYDTNVLAGQAAKRPDLRVDHADAFATADLGGQPDEVAISTEDADTISDRPATVAPPPSGGGRGPGARGGSGGGAGRGAAGADSTIVFPDDVLHSRPKPPTLSIILSAPKSAGGVNDPILLRGEFKRPFEFKYNPPREIFGGWLLVKKAGIAFSGKVDFKGQGKQTILISGLGNLATDAGGTTTSGGGTKAEDTLAEGKTASGVFGKLKLGGEISGVDKSKPGAQTDRGMKAELYVTGSVGWGWTSTELKVVLVGIDETKSVSDQIATGTGPFKILGIQWSIIPYENAVLEIPLTDGTTATFTGNVAFLVEAEPNWPKVVAEVGKRLGRNVVLEEGAIAAGGGTLTTGLAALGTGEFIVIGGALAGTALLLYAYYTSVQAIEQLKDLQTTARRGVDDFLAGYMTMLGFTPPVGDSSSVAGKEGSRHAEALIKDKIRAWRARENDSDYKQRQRDLYNQARRAQGKSEWPADKPYEPPKLSDDDLLEVWRQTWHEQSYEKISRYVLLAYETAIRSQIYRAFAAAYPGQVDTKAGQMNARARAGIPIDGDIPSDQPDLGWLEDLSK